MIEYTNKTKCPLSILRPLFEQTAEAVGIDTTLPLRVKITQGRTGSIKGFALRRVEIWDEIRITLPYNPVFCNGKVRLLRSSPLDLAISLWRVIAHEWGHVLDYQALARGEKREFTYYRDLSSRRAIRHDDRPQEQRANSYAKDAEWQAYSGKVPCFKSAIAELVEWWEQTARGRS